MATLHVALHMNCFEKYICTVYVGNSSVVKIYIIRPNWSRFGYYNVYLYDTRISYENFHFHLLTTSVNAKYYY